MPAASPTKDRLIVALSLALEEIHNPGANRTAGIDIVALCEGVLKQAGAAQVPNMVAGEVARHAGVADPLRGIVNAIGDGAF